MSTGPVDDQRACSADSSRHQSLMGQGQEVKTKLLGKIRTGEAVNLRHRGGGVSRLRKQARKRKFDQLGLKNHEPGRQSNSELGEGKTMRPLESLNLDKVLAKSKSGDALTMAPELREAHEKTSGIDPPAQQLPLKKASRFIVFIGSFPIELRSLLEADELKL